MTITRTVIIDEYATGRVGLKTMRYGRPDVALVGSSMEDAIKRLRRSDLRDEIATAHDAALVEHATRAIHG